MSAPRNLAIDDDLLAQALRVGGLRTKGETVNQALREFIARRHQLGLVNLFGKVDYDPSYDYKKETPRPLILLDTSGLSRAFRRRKS